MAVRALLSLRRAALPKCVPAVSCRCCLPAEIAEQLREHVGESGLRKLADMKPPLRDEL